MEKISGPKALTADALCAPFCASDFSFASTAEISKPEGWLGQERAVDAVKVASEIGHSGFNVFVLGPQGSDRHRIVHSILKDAAAKKPQPTDWVYLNNFDSPDKPIAVELPPGEALRLREAMEKLVDELAVDVRALFESDEYQTRRMVIEQKFSEAEEKVMGTVFENARKRKVGILRTPLGFSVVGIAGEDALSPEMYNALPEKEQREVDEAIEVTQSELSEALKTAPKRAKEHRREIEQLNYSMLSDGVDDAIGVVRKKFPDLDGIQKYLDEVRRDMIDNADVFLMQENGAEAGPFPVATTKQYAHPRFAKYRVNVMVSNAQDPVNGAPVVAENLPTLANLIGRMEYRSKMGVLTTDFSLIRPGALHLANGGYLVLDARQVLIEPFAWDALKRCLTAGEISIYSQSERLGFNATGSLKPDPIPLDLRVVLVGERQHYYLLAALDPDFGHLFKLEADFNDHLTSDRDTLDAYAQMIGSLADRSGARPLAADAVARLCQEGARLVGDSERLTLNVDQLCDIISEADFWVPGKAQQVITETEIEKAIAEADRRSSRIRELSQDAIIRETLMIDTKGSRIGQINALSVSQIGGSRFGRPTRLTARTRMGSGKLVDIERETELGGPLHSKGMLILQGYLASAYATDAPMSLWASLVFEQSYGGVDGDSASAAELLALLSSLSDLPIDQSFAITGSVNQFGDIQAIGGVNEKIEGFFDICAERGLTGDQGVVIPAANTKHLMLRRRVVEAVENGAFRIIPIKTIEDGMEVLMGFPAGVRERSGDFPVDSVNHRVEMKLRSFAQARRDFGKDRNDNGGKNGA